MHLPDNNNTINAIKPENNSYFTTTLAKLLIYQKCLNLFLSRNKLFKHIYANSCKIKELVIAFNPGISKLSSRQIAQSSKHKSQVSKYTRTLAVY